MPRAGSRPHHANARFEARTVALSKRFGLGPVIGLELQPARLAAMRREVFGVGSLQIALTGSVLTAYALRGRESWQAALIIGLALAVTLLRSAWPATPSR